MAAAGYSGTPLAKKLSLKPGLTAWFHAMPDTVRNELSGSDVCEIPGPTQGLNIAHIFTKERAELEHLLSELRHTIAADGFVWVSWPKKASKVPTDMSFPESSNRYRVSVRLVSDWSSLNCSIPTRTYG